MISINNYQSMANLTLFLKYRSGDTLMLSDIPSIITLRWTWFMNNWNFIRPGLISKIASYNEQDYLKNNIYAMDAFIAAQSVLKNNLNPFANQNVFFQFYGVFDNIEINSVNLTNQELTIVNNAINTVSLYNKNDFLNIRTNIVAARDTLADQIGLSDPTYNAATNRSSVPQQTTATIEDLQTMQYLQNCIFSVDFIVANIQSMNTSYVDPFALARVNANNPNFNISSYQSGQLVALNYGESLEILANKYLGDPNKWIDIAIANGLKPPYIDEVGQMIPLINNGSGNEITIAELDAFGNPNIDKIYINQVVILQSTTQNFPNQSVVTNIRQVPVSGEIIVGLSNDTNTSLYTTNTGAYLQVFAPNTINSKFFILIPSTQPITNNPLVETPYFLIGATDAEKRAGIDLSLDENGDLLFSSTGDVQLSYGLANAIQAIKLKMVTEAGFLIRHPEFGLVSVVGNTNNNIAQVQNLLIESINDQINLDPRFERLENLSVQYTVFYTGSKNATGFVVQMQVRLAGSSSTVIPISFTVTT